MADPTMTDEEFLKAPGEGTWLALIASGTFIAASYLGPEFHFAAQVVIWACGGFALRTVLIWLGRVIGYVAGEFSEGYREAREARLRQNDEQGR